MRVHIVSARAGADRILPRMARYLGDRFSWSVGAQPDPSVELNYFVSYITWRQRFHGWDRTPVAAYFTHKDLNNVTKAQWWEDTAAAVDLRCVSPERYAEILRSHGPVSIVRPPVERDHFVIARAPQGQKPVVGVAGYTYGDGRKGEVLIEQLARGRLAEKLELRASGRGWAIPTKGYRWQRMPAYYQSLDVLVCPSLMEAMPMPVFEALACGIKVVVPEGVGMMDELPTVPGIWRYHAGDYVTFEKAVEKAAFSAAVDRGALRASVAQYSVEHWCDDHLAAFEGCLYGLPEARALPAWKGNSGVYLVAFGEPSRKCAARAVESIRQHMPDLPGLSWTRPEGGLFLWVRLPDGFDAERLFYEALEQDVAFVVGTAFHCDGGGQNAIAWQNGAPATSG